MSDLKPCPFCGEEAKMNKGSDKSSFFVSCLNCEMFFGYDSWAVYGECCFVETLGSFQTKEKAITAWNTRAGE